MIAILSHQIWALAQPSLKIIGFVVSRVRMHTLLRSVGRSTLNSREIFSSHSRVSFQKYRRWYPVVSFNLADIGEGISQVDVLSWSVKEGDMVEQFTPLCEVQSDKATVPITSRYEGKIVKIHYPEGEVAFVGTPLCDIEVEDESSSAIRATLPDIPVVQPEIAASILTLPTSQGNHSTLSTPAVRYLAKKNNIDISGISGTGKDGRVNKTDVLSFLKRRDEPQAVSSVRSEPPKALKSNQVVQLRGYAKAMAAVMTESLTIPHLGLQDEIDVTNLVNLRQQIKQPLKERGINISFMPFMIKAASLAIEKYPIINSRINKELTEVTILASHNIAVAVATPQGLIVPNIKNVQNLSVLEITNELKRIVELAQANKLTTSDLADSTFSLSNIGSIGGTYASPVLVAPQVVIGAIGKIQELPRFDERGNVTARHLINISWSADHRVIDGASMANFSNQWKYYLENPATILLDGLK